MLSLSTLFNNLEAVVLLDHHAGLVDHLLDLPVELRPRDDWADATQWHAISRDASTVVIQITPELPIRALGSRDVL